YFLRTSPLARCKIGAKVVKGGNQMTLSDDLPIVHSGPGKLRVVVSVLFFSIVAFLPGSGSVRLACAQGVWEKTAGPPGLKVNVIYKANGFVYAGTEKFGLYRSADDGITWSAANAGLERA